MDELIFRITKILIRRTDDVIEQVVASDPETMIPLFGYIIVLIILVLVVQKFMDHINRK